MIKKFAKKCIDYTVEHIKYIVHSAIHRDEHGKELMALTMAFAILLSAVMYDPCITASARAAETNIENKPYVIMAGEKELAVAGSKAEADMVVDKVMAKYGVTTSAEKAICDPALTVEPKTTVLAERTPRPLAVEDAVNSILYQNSGKNPHFKVIVTNEMIKTEVKEYDVKVVKTSSMYKGTTKVAQSGKDGKYVVKGKTTTINGKVISETVYDKELVKKPVTKIIKVALNERDSFFLMNFSVYSESSLVDKLFGISWSDRESLGYTFERKLIEVDYLDIFIHYGIIGFIIYFLPLVYFIIKVLKNIKKEDYETWFYMLVLFLGFAVSALAGHVLAAPAVSIYLVLIMLIIKNNIECRR
jgi:hypothetical protein